MARRARALTPAILAMLTRDGCLALDAADRLRPLRDHFALDEADRRGVVYFDGNSLGALPKRTLARLRRIVEDEWGRDLIRSWNSAGWITLAHRVGDKIARVVGAGPGELVVTDSTSINLYKALSTAVTIVQADTPARRRIVSERTNFPSDLYIADTLARERGVALTLVDADELPTHLDERTAVLMLTHVNYRTGHMHDLGARTRAAHEAGALVIWDLAHSAGAVPVNLKGSASADAADFAVGCGYKYLNGGPGAPGFVWAHPRHTDRMDREGWRQPLSGWLGHAAPFEFATEYRPASGISRFVCGTPPILSVAALECGVDVLLQAEGHGGMNAIREKSITLTDLFIELVESRCAGHDLTLITPRDARARGSQVSFAHATGGYAIMQALIARGVIGDFRAPDILRFGFTPLYTRFADVWDAVEHLSSVLDSREWHEPRFHVRAKVT
ncbi:MAG TPA: kynureninase [Vicinamibacterales bacterium]|nr:kynureninase [Vicinamibacterales bacterium]